jgi:hypothetical protein
MSLDKKNCGMLAAFLIIARKLWSCVFLGGGMYSGRRAERSKALQEL